MGALGTGKLGAPPYLPAGSGKPGRLTYDVRHLAEIGVVVLQI
jgi:hypothetical protein